MATEKHFPNGFESWAETHHEIVSEINRVMDTLGGTPRLNEIQDSQGSHGMYSLAIELTDQFERDNQGVEWGSEDEASNLLDWHETLEAFLLKYL